MAGDTLWDAERNDLRADDLDELPRAEAIVPAGVAVEVLRPFFENDDVELGFDEDEVSLEDLEIGVSESSASLVVDWRAVLTEELPIIEAQLAVLGIDWRITAIDDDECGATIEIADRNARVRYRPADDDPDFDVVIAAIHRLVGGALEYRRLRASEGSDTYEYAVLPARAWSALDARHPHLVDALFERVLSKQ